MIQPMIPSTNPVSVGSVTFGGDRPFALIAGPCVIESRDHILRHAEAITGIGRRLEVPIVFKSSFDKANRTSIESFRGVGMDEGLAILAEVRREFDVPVLTDVHDATQCAAAAEAVDCLQIPAFLCRQTDLLTAAAKTGKAVNVKKGQFLAPEDTANIVRKVKESGNDSVMLTERGTSFGYRCLVVDFAGFPTMRATGQPLVFDATHSVQRPGGEGRTTGGDRTKVPFLARAAVACGVDGLFMEVHEDPDHAPSDGPNMLRLDTLEELLLDLRRVERAVRADVT
ncbi:MAG: 3-deoxy-8-phosphooctulonate synthase [Planctomycetes bacterium]|nr:3-deoxy-8-phosphooctulonate synthase [Planctomycetota bacterium]